MTLLAAPPAPTPAQPLAPDAAARAAPKEWVAFLIERQEFCIEIFAVREIRGWTPTTPLPHAPAFVRGVINLRGVVLPVIDLAARLGFQPIEPHSRSVIVVTQIERRLVGLLVDAVSEILSADLDSVQPAPTIAGVEAAGCVKGILPLGTRLVSWLALEALLALDPAPAP